MEEYIDKNQLKEKLRLLFKYESFPIADIEEIIDWLPVIPKHGKWIKNEDRSGWHCSCCGKDDLYAYPYTENNERELQDFYCPNCGADMREVSNDN